MSRTIPSRVLDAVYDPVHLVSTSGGTFRKGNYIPSKQDGSTLASSSTQSNSRNNKHLQPIPPGSEGQNLVSGSERPKYFRRPILPHLQSALPEVLLAPSLNNPAQTNGFDQNQTSDDAINSNNMVSVGIQTVYRDSEAQTEPYTPDYTIKKVSDQPHSPEILSLLQLSHKKGNLPIGPSELVLIDREREKRVFEASLPPMTDEASFLLRKAMMEARERMEWAYREAEIDALHEERVSVLRQALHDRDREMTLLAEQRIDSLRQTLLHQKENTNEEIQHERVVVLRKLTKKRASGALTAIRKTIKRDIISEYAQFASDVYAPVKYHGKVGNINIHETGLEDRRLRALPVLMDFEKSVPSRLLNSKTLNKETTQALLNPKKTRKQASIDDHLLHMELVLKRSKEEELERGDRKDELTQVRPHHIQSNSNAKALKTRPKTPNYSKSPIQNDIENDDALHDALCVLQKLIRGRAVQNTMFEGKERRIELIRELRASESGTDMTSLNDHTLEGDYISSIIVGKATGEIVSECLDFFYKERDRAADIANVRLLVDSAVEERQIREAEEFERRRIEDILRARENAVLTRLVEVAQETSNDFISSIINGMIHSDSQANAETETEISTNMQVMVQSVEESLDADTNIIRDLVSTFLFPRVEMRCSKQKQEQEDRKYCVGSLTALQETFKSIAK